MGRINFPQFNKLSKSQINNLLISLKNWYEDENILKLNKFNFYLTSKEKVYISNIDLEKEQIKRVLGIGLYFGTLNENRFRLSIEGSKLINPIQNYIKLNEKSINSYISGENLFIEEAEIVKNIIPAPFLIVKYGTENLGVVSIKNNLIHTFVPKGRRLGFNKLF